MSDPVRTAVLTTLLHGDESARRLLVSWPAVSGHPSEHATLAEWARAAGVPRTLARRLADMLFSHAICRPDHSVDPEAVRIVQHVAAEQLRGGKRRTT